MDNYKYRATCHTKCYWLNNLWQPGEVYEGNVHKPNKHFNESGEAPEAPPPTPMDDPRSNAQLREELKKHPYNFKAPSKWIRKQLWAKLKELEMLASKDAAPDDSGNEFVAACGFQSKSRAGVLAHERKCADCQEKIEAT